MIGFYLSTVITWMIIIFCEILIFKNAIVKNGWVEDSGNSGNNTIRGWVSLFAPSAIPVFRLLVAIALAYMAFCTKEDFEKRNGKNKEMDMDIVD